MIRYALPFLLVPWFLASGLLASGPLAREARAAEQESCVTHCHGKEATAFRTDVHATVLSCFDCHKGDPGAARDKERSHALDKGFIGKVSRDHIPELCGGCHADAERMAFSGLPTDQLAQYRHSAHGKAIFERANLEAAVCTDCHDSHGIQSRDNPNSPTRPANLPRTCGHCHSDAVLMAKHDLPSDTVARFQASVHGVALVGGEARGAPSCVDCHGKHGAERPIAERIFMICSRCHISTAKEYRRSPHFSSEEMTCASCHADEKGRAYRRADCTACHDSHSTPSPDTTLYTGTAPGSCRHCHADPGAASELVDLVQSGLQRMYSTMLETEEELEHAKSRGLFLDHEEVYLRESRRALIALGPLVHSLESERIADHLRQGVQRQDRTREKIAKTDVILRDRMIVLATVCFLLLLLVALLGFKLKALRRLA